MVTPATSESRVPVNRTPTARPPVPHAGLMSLSPAPPTSPGPPARAHQPEWTKAWLLDNFAKSI